MLIDEAAFQSQPLVRATWAERGRTPILAQTARRNRLSVVAALVLSPKRKRVRMFFDLLSHNARSEDFVRFLAELHQELGRKLHVVWDNLAAHRKTERFFRAMSCRWVRFHRLPPYAPELNPVEHVWSVSKWGGLANQPIDHLHQLHDQVNNQLGEQALKQQLLKAHFQWAKLKI